MTTLEKSQVMHCPKCNEVVSITNCSWVSRMMVKYKTFKEMNKQKAEDNLRLRTIKNGIIEALHRQIGKLIDLMTEEQKEKVRGMTQEMRETIKTWEKKK